MQVHRQPGLGFHLSQPGKKKDKPRQTQKKSASANTYSTRFRGGKSHLSGHL
jgi:hypothetical protein